MPLKVEFKDLKPGHARSSFLPQGHSSHSSSGRSIDRASEKTIREDLSTFLARLRSARICQRVLLAQDLQGDVQSDLQGDSGSRPPFYYGPSTIVLNHCDGVTGMNVVQLAPFISTPPFGHEMLVSFSCTGDVPPFLAMAHVHRGSSICPSPLWVRSHPPGRCTGVCFDPPRLCGARSAHGTEDCDPEGLLAEGAGRRRAKAG